MDALLKKLDKLSSPLGSLFDAALDRLVPHTTASACGGHFCYATCSGVCGPCCGNRILTVHYALHGTDCSHTTACISGCACRA